MTTIDASPQPPAASQWAWMRQPAVRQGLIAFAIVHILCLVWLWPTIARGDALGDLEIYRSWAVNAFSGEEVPGLRQDWVYPLLAWLPIGIHRVKS